MSSHTVKSHIKALGLYNFKRGFGRVYKRGGGGLYPGGLIGGTKKNVSEKRDKTYLRNELKLTYHYILSYIYNTFIVYHNKRRIYFKNIYKTDFRLKTLMFKKIRKRNTLIQWMGLKMGGGLISGGLKTEGA